MKKGFTLAEVLITLAIIGVVATLTIPGIIGNYRSKVLMTQLQNTLNLVQSAVINAMNDFAAEDFSTVISTKSLEENFLKNYFDTVALCDKDTGSQNCLADTYDVSGNSAYPSSDIIKSHYNGDSVCAALTSGATVCIEQNKVHAYTSAGDYFSAAVRIDVNGIESPNMGGKDYHTFYLNKAGKIIYGETLSQIQKFGYCSAANHSSQCLPLIISKGWKFQY